MSPYPSPTLLGGALLLCVPCLTTPADAAGFGARGHAGDADREQAYAEIHTRLSGLIDSPALGGWAGPVDESGAAARAPASERVVAWKAPRTRSWAPDPGVEIPNLRTDKPVGRIEAASPRAAEAPLPRAVPRWTDVVRMEQRMDRVTVRQHVVLYGAPLPPRPFACRSPLVLNFAAESPVRFDDAPASFDLGQGSGATDWVDPATPWLALDRDGDGRITSGAELFGDATPIPGGTAAHGFEALTALDSNDDGAITALDDRYDDLLVWADADGNRMSTTDELRPAADVGLVSVSLDFTVERRCDERGNCERERSAMTWTDDAGVEQAGAVIDVWLSVRPPAGSDS